MVPQMAFVVFLASSAVIFLVFAHVALSTRRSGDYRPADRMRLIFFLGLGTLLAVSLAATVPKMPYPVEAAAPDRVVHVVGKQFAFALSEVPIDAAEWAAGPLPARVEVPAGALIEFRVSTLDVNHGFSLYTPDGQLLAQTQAMPGYVNRLRMRFDRPGTYTVLCLEYCGRYHHQMRGAVVVR